MQPTDEYNAKIQKRLEKSIFVNCTSWYRTGRDGKIINIFPGYDIWHASRSALSVLQVWYLDVVVAQETSLETLWSCEQSTGVELTV